MSRFGTVEMTRSKPAASLDEILNNQYGQPTDETLALRPLRRLEVEARANAGAQLTLFLPERAKAWLESDLIEWRSEITNRIGARYSLESHHDIDVKSDR